MAKVKVLVQPSGCLNGYPWPEVGETVDLPDDVAEEMAKAKNVEVVKSEPKKAPAKKAPAKKAAPEKVESRPSQAKAEKRS